MEHIGPIDQGKRIGEWFEKHGQLFNGKKEPAEENHGKAEEVGKGLSFENLAHRHGDKKAQEG